MPLQSRYQARPASIPAAPYPTQRTGRTVGTLRPISALAGLADGPRPVSAFDLISGAVDGLARVAEHADAIASRLLGDSVAGGPQLGGPNMAPPYPPGIVNRLQHDADRVQAAMARIDGALSRIERALP